MPKEIKTTIAVDGEAAFKRAINDATTSLRNMGTQLTLAQAEFKKDGDAMKLMETRSKALKGEIGQQEEIVKALEKAVSDSAKAYGENSDKTEKWQAELNRAKAKLANLQNELTLNEQGLDRNGKAFDDSSQKAADYQATLQTIGKNVSFQTISEGIKGVTGAIKKVFNFAKAIRETFADAGEWADTLMTDATKYGMDVETLQRWQNAADLIDTPVETIITARDKLTKKLKGEWKNSEGTDLWGILGIDKTADKEDIFWNLGAKLMWLTDLEEKNRTGLDAEALSMEVFGKSWRDLLPLFTAGREEWEKTVAEQDVVSEQRVKALGELDDANQALENSWDVAKYSFLADLAPTVTDVTNAVTDMIKAFNEWMDTDEGKQAMSDLSAAIKELFSGLKDVKFKDAIDTVQKAIEGIKTALSWLDEHKNDVVTALEIIAGGFALLKVADLAIDIGKIVSGFRTLWAGANKPLPSLSGINGGGNGTSTPTTSPTTGTDTVIGTGAAGGAGVALGNMVTGAAAKVGAFITANSGLLGAAGDMFLNQTNAGRAVRDGTNVIEGLTQDVNEKVDEIKHNAETFGDDWKDVWENNPVINWFRNLGKTNKEANDWVLGDDVTAEDAAEFVRSNGDKDWRPSYMRGIEPSIPEIEENINLDEVYTPEQIADAIQDWWDARQNANNGTEPWSEEETAYRWMEEVLGDKFTDFWDTFVEKTEGMDTSDMEDIPADWYSNLSADLSDAVAQMKVNTEASRASSDKIASADFKRFNGLPVEIQRAAQAGTAAGVSGIKVYMDGSAVGRLVAPYVSAIIANAVG